jgi:hypothetical protein
MQLAAVLAANQSTLFPRPADRTTIRCRGRQLFQYFFNASCLRRDIVECHRCPLWVKSGHFWPPTVWLLYLQVRQS